MHKFSNIIIAIKVKGYADWSMNLRSLLKFDLAMQSMSWTASSDGVDEITAVKSCSTEIIGGCYDGADGRGDVEDVRGEVEVFRELSVHWAVSRNLTRNGIFLCLIDMAELIRSSIFASARPASSIDQGGHVSCF